MEKEQIKKTMLQLISEEIDQWLETQDTIKEGHEYEEKFIAVSRKVNQILLTQSMGKLPKNRNKKNFRPVLEKSK